MSPSPTKENKDAGIRDLGLHSITTTLNTTTLVVGQGRSIEAYITSKDEMFYGPLVFWIQDLERHSVVIDSLGSVNYVLGQIQKEPTNQRAEILGDVARALLLRQRVVSGASTGVPLIGTYRARFLAAIRKSLPQDSAQAVESQLVPPSFSHDGNSWQSSWIEIDRLGGAERVIAEGPVSPWTVKRVLRESLFSPGLIPQSLLQGTTIIGDMK